jgi:chemotaxis protein methyltransferase CheR
MIPGAKQVHLTQLDRVRLRALIAKYSGLDRSALTDIAMERAIAQRLGANQLDRVSDYWPVLHHSSTGSDEMGILVRLLTNKDTFFFRETHQFQILSDIVLPELLAVGTTPVRFWSAGCSTGEEPYSLAITLLEYQARHGSLEARIIATDIDEDALSQARRGCYDERSMRLVPAGLRRRHFSVDGGDYRVSPEVARLVTFKQHNLNDSDTLPELAHLDVIFCRNVAIYLDEVSRDRLNAQLADSLREGGYLFVASAETRGHDRGRLELVSMGQTFLFHKPQAADRISSTGTETPGEGASALPVQVEEVTIQEPVPLAGVAPDPEVLPAGYMSPDAILSRAVEAFQEQEYDAALVELDYIPDELVFWPEASCLRAAILVQQELLAEAEGVCQHLLAHDPWYADAHFLMGLIFRQQGRVEMAIQSLKQAIHLQPVHRDAHYFLAEIYRVLGRADQSLRAYRNALNILAHEPADPSMANLGGLKDDALRQVCEGNLGKLQAN